MKKTILKRYEDEVLKLTNSKTNVDISFLSGVISGIRTGLFIGTDMSLDEYNELIELEENGSIRRECVICYDKTFENDEGQQVSCHHSGYEVHFVGDFTGNERCWWNEYEDSEGNLYYGR